MPTKSQKLDTTKEKLRRAAHDLLSACSSPAEVTSRAIAEKAGVPVAMINYSFGSREALLFAVFQDLYTQIVASDATLSAILRSDATPKAKLKALHLAVLRFMLDNFSFSEAILRHVLLHRDLSVDQNSLPFVIAHFAGSRSDAACRLIAYELSSTMQLVVLRHVELSAYCGLQLDTEAGLIEFVDRQMDLYLPDSPGIERPDSLVSNAKSTSHDRSQP